MEYLTVRQFEAIFELSSKSLVQFLMEQEHVALHHGKHRYRTWSNSLTRNIFLNPSVFKLYRKLQDYWWRNECFSYLSSLWDLIMNENNLRIRVPYVHTNSSWNSANEWIDNFIILLVDGQMLPKFGNYNYRYWYMEHTASVPFPSL